jgi:hypothetical protein
VSDMWHEASADHDLEAREASLAQAEAQMLDVWPFLFQARSGREFAHRLAFAGERLERIAAACGLPPGELEETARRRYALLKEALPEGTDPVAPVLQAGQSFGSGPAEGYEHDEGPDFSHGYSEIPAGPLGGPDPAVTGVPEPAMAGQQPAPGTTAGKKGDPFGGKQAPPFGKGKKKKKGKGKKEAARTAQVTSGPVPVTGMPPTGAGGQMMPAGTGAGAMTSPDGMSAGGSLPGAQRPSGTPAAQPGTAGTAYDLTPAQDVTAARRDPVRRQVEAVAASVAASNPQLPASECRRVARRVVGSYLRQADMASSVMSDEPWAGSPGSSGDGDGGGGGMSGMEEYGLGRQLINKLPGGGAGAAGELAEGAELAAL